MHNEIRITSDMFYIGGNDRRLSLFEGVYAVPEGVTYNSYFIDGAKTVVLDTVDKAISDLFFENVTHLLAGRPLDYLIVNHMEPDHSAALIQLADRYPQLTIVCTSQAGQMIDQFFPQHNPLNVKTVKEGDTLTVGRHTFQFVAAPMVHWPEVMVTYDQTDKILYSADAFGSFKALAGGIYNDQIDFAHDWLNEARRYYGNIVGKYGPQVMALLTKAAALDIKMICPLHGVIWRSNIDWLIGKYTQWATYTPEVNGVLIVYASIYGHTANAAEILAAKLNERGVSEIAMYDVSVTHSPDIIAQAFKYSHIVFASPTYNMGIFYAMENVLADFAAHQIKNRTVAIIENGSWAPASGRLMKQIITQMPDLTLLENTLSIRSALNQDTAAQLDQLADAIFASLPPVKVGTNAMYKLTYGLFVLTARQDEKDNGCIINTAVQVTDKPKRLSIAVIKGGKTHEMIMATGQFNISIMTEKSRFETIRWFGMQSGRTADKFGEPSSVLRTDNGIAYIADGVNAVISCKVISQTDMGSHTIFFADVTAEKILNDDPSLTYGYYQANIKPKAAAKPASDGKMKRWVCKICGYIYTGTELPPDYICPLCKHDASYFEPLD